MPTTSAYFHTFKATILTPQKLLDAAKNANPGSDDDAVVPLDEGRWVFDKAGDMRHVLRVVAHIQTPQGVQDWSNLEWALGTLP